MFTRENPELSHLKIFGCLVYLHVPKEKRSKLDSSRMKGIFVGYNEQSIYYRIYIPLFHWIEISRDVTFDEDATFTKFRKIFVEEEAPRITEATRRLVRDSEEDPIQDDNDLTEPQELMETPQDMISTKIRPEWARDIIREAKIYADEDHEEEEGALRTT